VRRLENRVALVTAAGSGMGKASAERFASEDAHVIVSDLDEAAAIKVADQIAESGGFMRPEGTWGGFKLSGFGREMGDDGFREFFQVKHIQWPIR
jgi:NAD(P)-dependent dehydrogenase (short-subunit alcohol dehydrogenase family)